MLALCLSQVAAAGLMLPTHDLKRPLVVRSERISVRVDNQVLQAKVEQVFANQSSSAVEAIYLQPVPAGAAVSGFAYWQRGKRIESQVKTTHNPDNQANHHNKTLLNALNFYFSANNFFPLSNQSQ